MVAAFPGADLGVFTVGVRLDRNARPTESASTGSQPLPEATPLPNPEDVAVTATCCLEQPRGPRALARRVHRPRILPAIRSH